MIRFPFDKGYATITVHKKKKGCFVYAVSKGTN